MRAKGFVVPDLSCGLHVRMRLATVLLLAEARW
jgi:hypothetical protein